jgi:prevent-host-death family protein
VCYTWSMVEVASRDLRNDTRGLLRGVDPGEDIVITVDGRRVAVLRPIRDSSFMAAAFALALLGRQVLARPFHRLTLIRAPDMVPS